MSKDETICFNEKDFKGSKLRCLELTNLNKNKIVNILNKLIKPYGEITGNNWMPKGFLNAKEAQLDKIDEIFIKKNKQKDLKAWWLTKYNVTTTTPNWDIISTCKINDKDGLLLVEAKAHISEMSEMDKSDAGEVNYENIKNRMNEINSETGWKLSIDKKYQLSNRFAWCWKLASMGIPVILVYLGFLKAYEWKNDFFESLEKWEKIIKDYSKNIVPENIWDTKINTNKELFYPLIRSLTMEIDFK